MVKNFELMEIHRTRRGKDGIEHDFDAKLPGIGEEDMVDSNPETIGTAIDIVRWLLKHELPGYKLVKKEKK